MILIGGCELIASLALEIWTSGFAVGMRLQLFSSKSQSWTQESRGVFQQRPCVLMS